MSESFLGKHPPKKRCVMGFAKVENGAKFAVKFRIDILVFNFSIIILSFVLFVCLFVFYRFFRWYSLPVVENGQQTSFLYYATVVIFLTCCTFP